MKRILIIALLLSGQAFAACTGSSPTWTSTPDYASVSSCFASSSRGDTINVSAGSATWLSQLVITHGITLQGAGVGVTTIRSGFNGTTAIILVQPDATALANSENVKIDGFTLDGIATISQVTTSGTAVTWSSGEVFTTGTAWVGIQYVINGVVYTVASVTDSHHLTLTGSAGVQASPVLGASGTQLLLQAVGATALATKPYDYIIVTNNKFQNVIGGGEVILINGQVRGVIASNTFDRQSIVLRYFGADSTDEWSNTAYNNFSFGSSDNLYFETNTIQWTTADITDTVPGWIETGQGGRIVARFNTWDFANTAPTEFWDIHGFQNFALPSTIGQTGTMIVEYYRNTITNGGSALSSWANFRGSWGIFFDNALTATSVAGANLQVNQYYNGVAGGSGCAADITPAPSNYNPVINNSYAWNNLANGARKNLQPGGIGNGCGIAENANYWNQTDTFDGTVGVGYGVIASRPATCTTGVGYVATDQGSWNTGGSGVQGVFYKCVSTNTWSLYYVPYTYPNPLVSAGGSLPVATLTSSLAVVKPGSTFTLTWGCTNTPTAASIDNGVGPQVPATGGTTSAITVAPGSTTYTLTCTNANGTGTATVAVTQGGSFTGANSKQTANTVRQ